MRKKMLCRILNVVLISSMFLALVACSKTKTVQPEDVEESVTESTIDDVNEEITPTAVKPTVSDLALLETMTAAQKLVPNSHEKLWSIDPPVFLNVAQGGCIVDGYLYQAFIEMNDETDELTNKCIIQKIDIQTGNIDKESKELQLCHANDITYNSTLGCLVLIQNQPVANSITLIDMETLEVKEQFAIDHFMFAISYHAGTEQYVIGQTQGKTFRILDSDFKAISNVFSPNSVTNSSTTQGMTSDDAYIYFALYGPNKVAVYDWDGNFVTAIELNELYPSERFEPENISVIDGELYVLMRDFVMKKVTLVKLSDFVPAPETKSK